MSRKPVPSAQLHSILLTNLLGFGTFITTGFPPGYVLLGVFISTFLLFLLPPPEKVSSFFVPFCSISFLILVLIQSKEGTPSIVILSNFASLVMVLQSILIRDVSSGRNSLLLSGMLVLASGAMNVNFYFVPAFFLYSISLLFTLDSIARLEQQPENIRVIETGLSGIPFPRAIVGGVMFLMTWLVLFYVLPRGEIIGMASVTGQQRLLGFSDTLKLGESGSISENSMVVMRVRPLVPPPVNPGFMRQIEQLHLRGCSFISYKKGSWSREGYTNFPVNLRRSRGELHLKRDPEDVRQEIFLEILLENTDPPILFVPDNTVTIFSDLPHLSIDTDNSISFTQRKSGVEKYRILTKLGKPLLKDFPRGETLTLPPFLRAFCDPGDVSYRVRELAESVTLNSRTAFEAAMAIQNYLRRNCDYAFEDAPSGIRDPVAYFLFQSHKGSCELFASSMALMLRCIGIPARPVNGYNLEEWNDFGGYFNVRQNNAHTWVEVFFPTRGWIPFDPTPANTNPARYFLEGFAQIRDLWDRFEAFWVSYVYSFDRNSQIRGFRRFRFALTSFLVPLGLRNAQSLFFLAIVVLISFIVYSRKLLFSGNADTPLKNKWIPEWYREWSRQCRSPRQSWETPREFHSRILRENLFPQASSGILDKLGNLVNDAAFGQKSTNVEEEGKKLISQL